MPKLEEAKRLYETANADQRYVLEKLFPELKESEDERILEIIKHCIESRYLHTSTIKGISQKQCFAWLEKQGQEKPAWSKEDERIKENLQSELCNLAARKLIKENTCDKYYNWLKTLRPQNTWKPSDEQMEALKGVQEGRFRLGKLESLYNDLKKLKEE